MANDSDSDLEITGVGSQGAEALPPHLGLVADRLSDAHLPVKRSRLPRAPAAESCVSGLHVTQDDRAVIEAALEDAEEIRESTVAQHNDVTVDGKGFATLRDDEWVQDGVVNTLLAKAFAAASEQTQNSIHLCSTFFMTKLLGNQHPLHRVPAGRLLRHVDYMSVRRWTQRSRPLANKSMIIVPVHESEVHWCLMVVDVPERCIYYYDSMLRRREYYNPRQAEYLVSALFAWVILEAHDKACVDALLGTNAVQACNGAPVLPALLPVPHTSWEFTSLPWRACLTLWHLLWQVMQLCGSMGAALGFRRTLRAAAPADRSEFAHTPGGRTACAQFVGPIAFAGSGWRAIIRDGLPTQQDEKSCGIFMTAFALALLQQRSVQNALAQDEVPLMRTAIAASLLGLGSGQLF